MAVCEAAKQGAGAVAALIATDLKKLFINNAIGAFWRVTR